MLPVLLLNCFGQGALLLRDPSAIENPFYLLAPRWFLYPLLIIATVAALVASQALISGAFSLAQQSVQLGYSPRLTIVHTSEQEYGRIYVPEIHAALMVGTLLIVLGFRSSSALGAAYGIAVTGTMAITTLLVAGYRWRSAVGLVLMTTWKRGREILAGIMHQAGMPLDLLLNDLSRRRLPRVAGTAVFLTSDTGGAPVVLLHHLKHNKVLHQQVVLMSVLSVDVPDAEDEERVEVTALEHGFFRVIARYGFMEAPNVPAVLALCVKRGLRTRSNDTSYFLSRERLLPIGPSHMPRWRKKLVGFIARNARSTTEYFGLPPNRVVELGAQIEF